MNFILVLPLGVIAAPVAIVGELWEEGERARLIQPANPFANDPRGLACGLGNGAASNTHQYDDVS